MEQSEKEPKDKDADEKREIANCENPHELNKRRISLSSMPSKCPPSRNWVTSQPLRMLLLKINVGRPSES